MSWVFLAGDEVYKLKKPVSYPFLDYSTLEARAANVRAEVHLNRRLAPDVYLGAVALTESVSGELTIGGKGPVVDWLVRMRRLPDTAMLDYAIEHNTVRPGQIEALSERLASFYERAVRADFTPDAYFARFARELADSRSVLLDSAVSLEDAVIPRTFGRVEHALHRLRPVLESRVRQGHVVEGHGDLRPEHVCLLDPPIVIDCLEFNRELRFMDPFDELAFLGMECARLGGPWIRDRLIGRCSELLQDHPPETLIVFYTVFRALVRARLSLAHLLETDISTPEKWRPLARRYAAIAATFMFRPQED